MIRSTTNAPVPDQPVPDQPVPDQPTTSPPAAGPSETGRSAPESRMPDRLSSNGTASVGAGRRWTGRHSGSRRHRRGRAGRHIGEVATWIVALVYLFPVIIVISVALRPSAQALSDPLGLPTAPEWSNFTTAWQQGGLGQALINSTVVALLSVAMLIALGSTTAYFFARRASRLSTAVYAILLLGLMIPLQLSMVPLYRMMNEAGLLSTYTSLILFYSGVHLPFTVFLYAGFLRALPRDFEEAAFLDGAGWWRTFRSVVFPLVRPVTVTVILLDAIDVWKDFLTPLLYVGGSPQRTLPVAIYSFRGEFTTQWGIVFAGVIISLAPVIILYALLQRFIIGGFAGGLKA